MRDSPISWKHKSAEEQNPLTIQTHPKNVGCIESNEAEALAILKGFTSLIHLSSS